VTRPLAGDAAAWWQAYLLAGDDRVDELRERAGGEDDHARERLAWLAQQP
jgi:hypothetical protein